MARSSRRLPPSAALAALALLAVAAAAPGVAAARAVLYRLEPESAATHGCLPPCLCPALISDDLRGTFELRRVQPVQGPVSSVLEVFRIRNVNWMVTLGGEEVHVTGSGTYTRMSEFAVSERIELDLRIGDDPPQRFVGHGVATAPFPEIEIDVSRAQGCFGTGFQLRALPVPRSEVLRYRLDDTTFVEGCLPPCLCVLSQTARVAGRFGLVDVTPARTGRELAVVGVRWRLRPIHPIPRLSLPHRIRGFGFYRLGSEAPLLPDQRMRLRLRLDRGEPTTFESGVPSGALGFPRRIDIELARNGFACFDQVIDLGARLRRWVR